MDSRMILAVGVIMGCLVLAVRGNSHLMNSTNCSTMQNITVGPLTTTITRDACGQTKLCEELPADCDPATSNSCLFFSSVLSASTSAGSDLAFELRARTSGYVALILSPDQTQGNDDAFICAQQNGSICFFTALFNNSALTLSNMSQVDNVLGSFTANVIRCTFTGLGINATRSRTQHNLFFTSLATGTFNGMVLGTPVISLRSSGVLNLANSTSNLPTTAGGNNGAAGLHHTSLALLVLLSALILHLF